MACCYGLTWPSAKAGQRLPIHHELRCLRSGAGQVPTRERVDYKDANVLRKFISDRGKIRARRVTGVTVQQQREIAKAVKNAREMALLPYSSSARSSRGLGPEGVAR